MRQWSLRVSAYAQRLLDGLNHLEWSDSLKDIQRNWIGRSQGADVIFDVKDSGYTIEDLYNPSRYDLWGELYGTGTGKRLCQATDHPRSGKSSS